MRLSVLFVRSRQSLLSAFACLPISFKKAVSFYLRISLLLGLMFMGSYAIAQTASVTSDKGDYAPRSTAVFTGSGFLPNEQVVLKVKNLFQPCHTVSSDSSYLPWTVTADDNGAFVTEWTVCDCNGDSLRLKATGQTSGYIAYVYFKDATNWTLTLGSNAQAASNYCSGTNGNIIHSFIITITSTGSGNPVASNLTGISNTISGSWTTSDISNFKLLYNTSNTVTGATTLATLNSPATGNQSFSFTNPALTNGTYYFFITADLSAGATNNNSLTGGATATSQITSTDGKAGSASASSAKTIKGNPNNVSNGLTGNTVCSGSAGTLTFDAADATFATPYTISYTDGNTTWNQSIASATATTFNVAVNPTTNTNYSLVSISNGNGCSTTSGFGDATATITVRPIPTASISGTTTVCQNSSSPNISFTNPQSLAVTVTYNINGGTSTTVNIGGSTSAIVAISTSTAGIYVYNLVSVSYQTAPNCSNSITGSATVTVNALPTTANAGSPQTICTTGSATLAANSPTTGTGAWSVVSGPNTNSTQFSSTTNPAATFTPAGGAGTYTLRWTISNSPCTASSSDVVITVNAVPTTANAGSPQTICTTGSATLAANSPTTGTGAWSVVSGPNTNSTQFSSTTNPAATFTPAGGAGTYTLRWTISNSPCTASLSDVVITVNAIPTASNAGSSQTICTTGSATLAANLPTTGTGAWSVVSGPNTNSSQFNSTSNPSATFTPAGGAGTYTLRWTISNSPCTASSSDVVITVSAITTASFTAAPSSACVNEIVTYTTQPGKTNYTWSYTGATFISGGGSTDNSLTIKWPSAGVGKTVTVQYTDGICLSTLATSSITVNALPTQFNVTGGGAYCNGGSGVAIGLDGSETGVNYQLKNGASNVGSLVAGTGNAISFGNVTGAATYTVIATNATTGCSNTMNGSATVTVNARPTATITSTSTSICNGGSTNITGTVTANGAWVLTLSGGHFVAAPAGTTTFSISVSPSSTTTYTITGLTDANCSAIASDLTGSETATVNPLPACSITGANGPVCPGSLNDYTTPASMSYAWSISGNGIISGSSSSQSVSVISGNNCNQSYTLTLTITDANGCESTCQKIVSVNDTEAPTLTIPADASAECNDVPAVGSASATDNCSDATVTYEGEVRTNGNCPNNYTLTRTWKAVDACGNTTTKSQVITVSDNTKPVLTVPADASAECDDVPAVGSASATDNCSDATVTYEGEVRTNGNCPNNYTLTRTWKAVDACGNTTTKSQVITVSDNTKPVLTVPADASAECDDVPAVGSASATDNCSDATVTYEGEVRTNGNCPNNYTLTRTWKAVDACGNTSFKSQTITITDTKAPTLTIPADASAECDDVPAVGSASATDNCSDATVTYEGEVRTNGNCPNNYTLTRTWKAVDACGNTTTKSQVITVSDNTKPVLTVPADASAECDDVPAVGSASATDNCSDATVTYEGEVRTNGNCPNNYTLTRTWKAVDACGNTSFKSQMAMS
jgi:hypothetical protein